jgi:hypothetical protein
MSEPAADKPVTSTAITTTPPPAAPVSKSATTYNPLSKLAVLGLSCAGLYAGIVVMSALVAVTSGTPLFLPDWLLFLPLAGAGLSLLASWLIRTSEGTLSGEKLARWGLLLSVVAGLGYGAYYLATGLAIQQQANHFLLVKGEEGGFFELIQKGDLNKAFLLTQRWRVRNGIDPNNPKQMQQFELPPDDKSPRGPLPMFAEDDIVQMIIQAGQEGKPVQPLGVRSWKYVGKEYHVERNYRIESEEVTVDIVVPVQSNDNDVPPGEPRRWTVLWREVQFAEHFKLTPLGKQMSLLRHSSATFFGEWLQSLNDGKLKKNSQKKYPENLTKWDSEPLQQIGSVELQNKIRQELTDLFAGKDKDKRLAMTTKLKFVPWKRVDDHVQFTFTMMLPVPREPKGSESQYMADVQVFITSQDKGDPMELTLPVEWDVTAVKVTYLREMIQFDPKKPKMP